MRSEKEPEIFKTADIKSLLSIFMRPLFSNLCDCKTEIRAVKKLLHGALPKSVETWMFLLALRINYLLHYRA